MTSDQVNAALASLFNRVKALGTLLPPAKVLTSIASGRRELGYEVGYLAVADANANANPVIGITVNNDADFVGLIPWVFQMGPSGGAIPIPAAAQVTIQIRDSATGDTFHRQPANIAGVMAQPYQPGAVDNDGRFVKPCSEWDAPHILKRGSSVFFEISNPGGYTFVGNLFIVYAGYRLYAGQDEPVPQTIKGQVEPYVWGGTLAVPNGLAAGFQKLGSIAMPGPDQNRYVLKRASIVSSGAVTAVRGITLYAADVLAINLYDTFQQNKLWARITAAQTQPIGQFMPARILVGGGTGEPWPWPRFIQGTDTIFVDLWGDPAAWTGGNPGTIEVALKGVRIYG